MTGPGGPAARTRGLVLGLALAAAAAACGGTGTPSGPATVTATSPAATAPASTAGPATEPPATKPPATARAASPTTPPGSAVEDPALLGVLPAEVAGQPVVLEPQAFADAIRDPAFAANVEAAAFAVVVAGDDLASAVVARPVPGRFGDAWFRDWRDSYDEGACGQAGGVAGTAETDLGGRTVFVATCGGGLRTYHTWLADRGLIVSVLAVGEGRYGEHLLAGLRP